VEDCRLRLTGSLGSQERVSKAHSGPKRPKLDSKRKVTLGQTVSTLSNAGAETTLKRLSSMNRETRFFVAVCSVGSGIIAARTVLFF